MGIFRQILNNVIDEIVMHLNYEVTEFIFFGKLHYF